jgi:MFS superfamily sulfate permease-like transporter
MLLFKVHGSSHQHQIMLCTSWITIVTNLIILVVETRFTTLEQAIARAILLASIQLLRLFNKITKPNPKQQTINPNKTMQ